VDPRDLSMPASKKKAFYALNEALVKGDLVLDGGADREQARSQLLALPGIGPWTASYIAMRALHDPDAFLVGDLGVRHAFAAQGLPDDLRSIEARAERWRPWRAYALVHLWASQSTTTGARSTTTSPGPHKNAIQTSRSSPAKETN
jgi:AraC family transcriptional regulator of adaptative response / DNA-3-methyladenine glycosylase II